MQVDVQVGMGSVHAVRAKRVPERKNSADAGSSACFPHGQCVSRDGERGHGAAVGDGV
jgi:hypothetical protein